MGRTQARITTQIIDQSNLNPNDPITFGSNVIGVTIRDLATGAINNNLWIGWNMPNPPDADTIMPGQSVSYGFTDENYIDENRLYLRFDPTGSGGRAVITAFIDLCE